MHILRSIIIDAAFVPPVLGRSIRRICLVDHLEIRHLLMRSPILGFKFRILTGSMPKAILQSLSLISRGILRMVNNTVKDFPSSKRRSVQWTTIAISDRCSSVALD